MNNKTHVICKKIQNLEFHKEQQELYDQGLRLEKNENVFRGYRCF